MRCRRPRSGTVAPSTRRHRFRYAAQTLTHPVDVGPEEFVLPPRCGSPREPSPPRVRCVLLTLSVSRRAPAWRRTSTALRCPVLGVRRSLPSCPCPMALCCPSQTKRDPCVARSRSLVNRTGSTKCCLAKNCGALRAPIFVAARGARVPRSCCAPATGRTSPTSQLTTPQRQTLSLVSCLCTLFRHFQRTPLAPRVALGISGHLLRASMVQRACGAPAPAAKHGDGECT